MLGYKKAKNSKNEEVIITLELLEDSITNINRKYIENLNFASYRCNKAKVIKIEKSNDDLQILIDKDPFKIYEDTNFLEEEAFSAYFFKKSLTYKVGDIVQTLFDYNIEETNTEGIHFFLNKDLAKNYNINTIKEGILINYWPNGVIKSFFTFKEGKRNGDYYFNYENGVKKEHGIFLDDVRVDKSYYYSENWSELKITNYITNNNYFLENFIKDNNNNFTIKTYSYNIVDNKLHGDNIIYYNDYEKIIFLHYNVINNIKIFYNDIYDIINPIRATANYTKKIYEYGELKKSITYFDNFIFINENDLENKNIIYELRDSNYKIIIRKSYIIGKSYLNLKKHGIFYSNGKSRYYYHDSLLNGLVQYKNNVNWFIFGKKLDNIPVCYLSNIVKIKKEDEMLFDIN